MFHDVFRIVITPKQLGTIDVLYTCSFNYTPKQLGYCKTSFLRTIDLSLAFIFANYRCLSSTVAAMLDITKTTALLLEFLIKLTKDHSRPDN